MTETTDPRILLEHQEWLQSLARSLVGDPNLADELVQDTWLSALRRPPLALGPVRGWLATVLRRQHGLRRRGEGRLRSREAAVARDEAQVEDRVVRRAAVHRELVRHVLSLDEPYRTTILLRFFEGLSYGEIARRQGTTTGTVNSRVTRGLRHLRTRIDREAADAQATRAVWLAPLLSARGRGSAVPWALALPSGMVVALLGIGVWAFGPWNPGPRVGGAANPSALHLGQPQAPVVPGPSLEPRGHQPRTVARPPADPPSPAAPEHAETLQGLVLDPRGRPVPGIRLALWGPDGASVDGSATSGEDGRFQLDAPPLPASIVPADPDWSALLAGRSHLRPPHNTVLVIAKATTSAGRVLDESGRPLAGVRVQLAPPRGFADGLDHVLDHSDRRTWRVLSEADGSFSFDGIPRLEGLELTLEKEGYRPRKLALGIPWNQRHEVILERPEATGDTLRGVVVRADGSPAPGACVSAGGVLTRTDLGGNFEVGTAAFDEEPWILAVERGLQPGRAELARDADGAWPRSVSVLLGAETRSLEGRVLDADGRPAAGARVWLSDPMVLAPMELGPLHVETFQADASRPFWCTVETDAEGRFRIEGLSDRAYRVSAIDPRTLARAEGGPWAAGSRDARLTLPDCGAPIRGVVRTSDGAPVPGASVTHSAITRSWRWHSTGVSRGVRSGPDGTFELADTCLDPRGQWHLRARGMEPLTLLGPDLDDEAGRWVFTLDPIRPGEDLAHFRVELASPAAADSFALLDAAGEVCFLHYRRGEEGDRSTRMPLVEGRSLQLSASRGARTLVIYHGRGQVETARYPIALHGGGTITVLNP